MATGLETNREADVQRDLQEKPKARLRGGEQRARPRSSPREFSRGAGELPAHSRAGCAPARREAPGRYRRPGDHRLPSPECAPLPGARRPRLPSPGPGPSSGAPLGRSIPASLQSPKAPARLPALFVAGLSILEKRGQVLPSDAFAGVAPEQPGAF